jgi:hypothetical protein
MVNELSSIGRPRRAEYTPQDFLTFRDGGSLEITAKFQRREVWKPTHRSWFIDTLIRGLPVPPIYLRETQSSDKRHLVREVIDGQQRIRAAIDFIDGLYAISGSIPAPWAGKLFSQLTRDQQDQVETFHFSCEVFSGISDRSVLEIFSRLNTYSVQLNSQELRNGKWFGHFKSCSYELAYEYLEYWRLGRIFTEAGIARMLEVELTSELLILGLDGIQDKKSSIDVFYAEYDDRFPRQSTAMKRFRATMDEISESCGDFLSQSAFRRVPLFYSLYGAVHHRLYGVTGVKRRSKGTRLNASERLQLSDTIQSLSAVLDAARRDESIPKKYQPFVIASLRQTDNYEPRLRRLLAVYDGAHL